MDATNQPIKMNMGTEVTIVINAIDGKPLNSLGLVDKRLFTGENNLKAVLDTQTMFWYLKYEHGAVPEQFKQKFTDLPTLLKFVREFYIKRNIEVSEIIY